MDSKYIAVVYEKDMNDILKKANILGTFSGMCADDNGRYQEMDFYEIGFDYPTWKQLRDAKIDLDYVDDEGNSYQISNGRCTNLNIKVKMKDVVTNETVKADAIREQIALKEKYVDMVDENGIGEYVEKKAKVVPAKKANCLVAVDKDSDLIMPFREIQVGSGNLPLFIYLHDKKSRGTSNSTMLLKECKSTIAALKSSGLEYMLVVPNVATSYGMFVRNEEGKKRQVPNSLNKLLSKVIDYEIKNNDIDPTRIYIMGAGSGVEDVMSELNTNAKTYAAAVLAFGVGYYNNIDGYKDIVFEVASASEDIDYADEEISNLVADIEDVGGKVNYSELDGKVANAAKVFFKDTTWLTNIFDAKRVKVNEPTVATAPLRKEEE